MAWGITNLLSAARTAAGGPIAVIGAVRDNTPGSYLGGIEKIHQAMGGVRGLASERLAQNTGINSLRTMGNILAKGRVTLTSRTDFEQKEYPSFGEGDILAFSKPWLEYVEIEAARWPKPRCSPIATLLVGLVQVELKRHQWLVMLATLVLEARDSTSCLVLVT